MKCDTCKHKKIHTPGSWYAVAEGGDDPFYYEYCDKELWCGDPIVKPEQQAMNDPWINCPNYEPKWLHF